MPYANVVAFQRAQAAIEATRGTEVTTMTRELVLLQQGGAQMTYSRDREDAPETTRSFAGDRDTAIVNEGVGLSFEARASYEEMPWWFDLALDGSAGVLSGVSDAGTPPAYTYSIDPVDTSDTLDTATIKMGDGATCYTLRRFAVNSMGLRCNPTATEATWRVTAEGPAIFVGTDTFDSPTDISRTMILSNGSKVYLDTGASAIGTTQLEGLVRSFSLNIANNIEEKRFVEGGVVAAADFGRGNQRITGDITIELLDDTYFALMRANTALKLRFEQTGAEISDTPTPYTFQVDIPQARFNAPSFSYAGNNKVMTLPFIAEKPAGEAAVQTTTINALATVTA